MTSGMLAHPIAEYALGLDGGQTTTRAAVCDLTGRVLWQITASPWDHMVFPAGRSRCRAALREVFETLPPVCRDAACRAACLGLTSGRARMDLVRGWIRRHLPDAQIEIVPDVVTNLRGADPTGRPGVVVIAGGGSNAWGRGPNGREAQAGGYGYLLNDEGSGYELGRQAIIAVLKASDGRRPLTALTGAVLEHFKVSEVSVVRNMVYTGVAGRPEVAKMTPAIARLACEDDPTAREIIANGARGLADMAIAVLRRLDFSDGPVYPTGGVFRIGPLILEPFTAAIAEVFPHARVAMPRLSPLGGALVMALDRAGVLTDDAITNLSAGLFESA